MERVTFEVKTVKQIVIVAGVLRAKARELVETYEYRRDDPAIETLVNVASQLEKAYHLPRSEKYRKMDLMGTRNNDKA